MPVPAITPLTDLPSITDPSNFDARADNLITQQFPRLVNEINEAGVAMDAAIEAAQAAAAVAINGTSSTSIAISTGSKNFTVLAGHSWSVGTWLMIASRASPSTHWFVAQVTAYNATLLTVSVHSFGGSGSRADWDISITAKPPPVATTTADGLMSAADKVKVNGAAPLASPAITGTPTAPTASPGTNTTQLATTAFVKSSLDVVIGGAPGALDTLDELAAALGDNANHAAEVINLLAQKAPLSGAVLTSLTIEGYTEGSAVASGTAFSPNLAADTLFSYTTTGNATVTLPAATVGKSFTVIMNYGGAHTVTWAGGAIRWTESAAPRPTSVSGKADVFSFMCASAGVWIGFVNGQNI